MVEGIDRLRSRLLAANHKLEDVVEEAMFKGADEVVAYAKFMAPKDTGHLASTIKRSGMMKTKKGNPKVEISAGDDSTLVGTRQKFQLAKIKELGAKNHPAEPFLRPALRSKKPSIMRRIKASMRKVIKIANGTNTGG